MQSAGKSRNYSVCRQSRNPAPCATLDYDGQPSTKRPLPDHHVATKTSAKLRSSITGRLPAGKIAVAADQAAHQPARSGARVHAGRGRGLRRDRARSARGAQPHRARQPGRASITNGTAVLGLGAIGPLAAKPVMEGKAVLFKKFAGIDVLRHRDRRARPATSSSTSSRALEPTFGGINLEDIKAPECFYIERKLRERHEDPGVPRRPARHRDHRRRGDPERAAASSARTIGEVKLVVLRRRRGGARVPRPAASRSACARENISVTDIEGVVYEGRKEEMDAEQGALRAARPTARKLAEVIEGADVFLGLVRGRRAEARDGRDDGGAAAHPRARQSRARDPARAREGRRSPTRSSPPAARTIRTRSTTSCASRSSSAARSTSARRRSTSEMKLAAVRAIAELAQAEQSDIVAHRVRRAGPVASGPTT